MPKPGRTGLVRILHAFGYSMQGMVAAFKNEAAFRQEVLLAVLLVPAAFFITADAVERSLLLALVNVLLIWALVVHAHYFR